MKSTLSIAVGLLVVLAVNSASVQKQSRTHLVSAQEIQDHIRFKRFVRWLSDPSYFFNKIANTTSIFARIFEDVTECIQNDEAFGGDKIRSDFKNLFEAIKDSFRSFIDQDVKPQNPMEMIAAGVDNVRNLMECIRKKDPAMYPLLSILISG